MKKLKTVDPKGNLVFLTYICDRGGVGYIRTILPSIVLGSYRYKNMSFDPMYLSSFVPIPNGYKNISFIKFQRSASPQQLDMIRYFKKEISNQSNTPAIYETDDSLFNIPKGNFASDYYGENKKYIEEMLRIVDGITVSTPYLRKMYSKYNKNISVVKNRLAKCLGGEAKHCKPVKRERPVILYPGSQNHFSIKKDNNEGDIGKELYDFILKTKNEYQGIFVGGIPQDLKTLDSIKYYPGTNYTSYPQMLKSIDADIGIAPLEINDFNRGKSNLKLLEYTNIGIPGIYTDIEPYRNASCKCETEEHMISKIQKFTKNPDLRYNTGKKDYDRIKSDMFLEDNIIKGVNEHLKLFDKKISQ